MINFLASITVRPTPTDGSHPDTAATAGTILTNREHARLFAKSRSKSSTGIGGNDNSGGRQSALRSVRSLSDSGDQVPPKDSEDVVEFPVDHNAVDELFVHGYNVRSTDQFRRMIVFGIALQVLAIYLMLKELYEPPDKIGDLKSSFLLLINLIIFARYNCRQVHVAEINHMTTSNSCCCVEVSFYVYYYCCHRI